MASKVGAFLSATWKKWKKIVLVYGISIYLVPQNFLLLLNEPFAFDFHTAMVIEVANEIPVFALGSRISHFEPT